MKRTENVTLSTSLWSLLDRKKEGSRSIRLLYRSLSRLKNGRYVWTRPGGGGGHHLPGTRILNPEMMGDFFTFREKRGMISYMPRGRQQEINEDGTWSLKGRQATSPGKWMRSMFSEAAIKRFKLKDNEFADLSTAVKHEELANEISFREVNVEDAYKIENFRSPPPESCMWGHPVGEFYDLFETSAVVCVDGNGEWRARAILWRNVRIGKKEDGSDRTITFMDRIYADSEEICAGMMLHARKSGWHHKYKQSRGPGSIVTPEGEVVEPRMQVMSVHCICADFYPYLDTFTTGYDSSLTTSEQGEYEYDCTDGSRGPAEEDEHEGEVQDIHGNWIDADDAIELDGETYHYEDDAVIRTRAGEYALAEDCCEIGGDWYERDDYRVVWSGTEDTYLLRRHAVQVNGEWYSDDSEDIVYSEPAGATILKDDAVRIRGQWYPADHDDIVEIDDEWVLKEDCEEVDGEWYRRDDLVKNELGEWVLKSKWDEKQLPLGVAVDGELVTRKE